MTKDFADQLMAALMPYSDVFASWTFEHPGYIALRTDGGGVWNIGTANGTFGADLHIDEDAFIDGASPDHSIGTSIDPNEPDVDRVASALYRAMTETP